MSNIFKELYKLFFLLLILNSSCGQEKNIVLDKFENKVSIVIQREKKLKDQLDPKSIYLMDSVIVLNSRGVDDCLFSIIDTVEFKEIARFGLQGKGPLEIGAIGAISRINGDSILVTDMADKDTYLFSVKNVLKGNLAPINVYHTKNKKTSIWCTSLTMMGIDNTIIGTGIHAEGRYAVYDETGFVKNFYIEYPKLELPSTNDLLQAMAFQSVICKQKGDDLLASLSHGTIDILEYKQASGINLKKRSEFYGDEMKFTGNAKSNDVVYPTVATSIKSMIGFEGFHFQSTKTSIYSLFSSRSAGDFIELHSRPFFTDLITLDWDGNPQNHYSLNKEVFGFAISDDNEKVFFLAYNEDGEIIILKAQLNGRHK